MRDSRTYTLERERSGDITSNDGFSVVAPIRTSVPFSTLFRRAACCDLLKRCISSMNSTVRLPMLRAFSAASMISLSSFTPDDMAFICTKSALSFVARRRASVVFPEPGGPTGSSSVCCASPASSV